jgi:hypothetical protein
MKITDIYCVNWKVVLFKHGFFSFTRNIMKSKIIETQFRNRRVQRVKLEKSENISNIIYTYILYQCHKHEGGVLYLAVGMCIDSCVFGEGNHVVPPGVQRPSIISFTSFSWTNITTRS